MPPRRRTARRRAASRPDRSRSAERGPTANSPDVRPSRTPGRRQQERSADDHDRVVRHRDVLGRAPIDRRRHARATAAPGPAARRRGIEHLPLESTLVAPAEVERLRAGPAELVPLGGGQQEVVGADVQRKSALVAQGGGERAAEPAGIDLGPVDRDPDPPERSISDDATSSISEIIEIGRARTAPSCPIVRRSGRPASPGRHGGALRCRTRSSRPSPASGTGGSGAPR